MSEQDERKRFEERPIDMVLHCPACGLQHIDAAEPNARIDGTYWDSPPHRSHLCHGCGHVWRPADVPTNGVAAVKTTGKADSPPAIPRDELVKELAEALRDMFAMMDEGLLVRSTADDAKPDYSMRMLGFVRRLGKAHAVLAKVPHA